MFEDLYDAISRMFSWWWPTTHAEITDVEIERTGDRGGDELLRLCVLFKFYVGEDGPYCGEDFWQPAFSIGQVKRLREAKQRMKRKHTVPVRYRRDDPSVNCLDREAWRDL